MGDWPVISSEFHRSWWTHAGAGGYYGFWFLFARTEMNAKIASNSYISQN
jgi:hypothetical protein